MSTRKRKSVVDEVGMVAHKALEAMAPGEEDVLVRYLSGELALPERRTPRQDQRERNIEITRRYWNDLEPAYRLAMRFGLSAGRIYQIADQGRSLGLLGQVA